MSYNRKSKKTKYEKDSSTSEDDNDKAILSARKSYTKPKKATTLIKEASMIIKNENDSFDEDENTPFEKDENIENELFLEIRNFQKLLDAIVKIGNLNYFTSSP